MAESYDFIQGRLRVDSEKLSILEELLTSLNESSRRAFAISIRKGIKPSDITREWVESNNCLYSHAQDKVLDFTSIQRSSIARRAAACRNVANATAKVELESIQERLPALRKKIQQDRDTLAAMKSQPTFFAKNKLAHKQEDLCRKKGVFGLLG